MAGEPRGDGGGVDEDEDIEVIEIPFAEALAMVGRGEIADAKTIAFIYFAKVAGLLKSRPARYAHIFLQFPWQPDSRARFLPQIPAALGNRQDASDFLTRLTSSIPRPRCRYRI